MDFSAYGDAQAHQQSHHHQQYAADPSQAYDYYYQQYSAHQPYLHHQQNAAGATASSAAYYYPQDYSAAASGGAAAAGGADGQPIASSYAQQPHAEPNIHPPGIDLSNLAQVAAAAAAAAANQPNGYFPQGVMEHQPHGNPMPPFPHLIAGPAEPRRMMPGFRENQWGGKRGGFGPPRGAGRVQNLCPNPRLIENLSRFGSFLLSVVHFPLCFMANVSYDFYNLRRSIYIFLNMLSLTAQTSVRKT